MKKIAFQKYHALGNDFIIIDRMGQKTEKAGIVALAREICDRQTGIGADGILILHKSRAADCRFDIYNADGSWAEKSGNGLRIAAAHIFSHYFKKRELFLETARGVARAQIIRSGQGNFLIRVSLGKPDFRAARVPLKSRHKFHINLPLKMGKTEIVLTALSVGNPHAVIFVRDFGFDWQNVGRVIEICPHFPRRTNVEFARIVNRKKVILNDWERGAGATGSSGTGAAATVAAAVMNGFMDREAEVVFPRGSLFIEWSEVDDEIFLTGPVEPVAEGNYLLK